MELKQLHSFVTIVELGSFGKASQKLDVGTSALSQQISKLESELSTRLLQRSATGVMPTPAGLAFFKQAQLVLRHAQQAIDAAHSSRLTGYVNVGFPPSTASILGVPFLQFMAEHYPDIKVHLIESLSGNLISMINTGQLDLAIIFQKNIDKNWSIQALAKESVFLIGNSEFFRLHHLEKYFHRQTISLQDLQHIPLAMPTSRHGLRRLVDQHDSSLQITYEIDGLTLLMNAVTKLPVGTIQPGSVYMNHQKDNLHWLKITDKDFERTNYLISLPENELNPASLVAKSAIRSCIKDLINRELWPSTELI